MIRRIVTYFAEIVLEVCASGSSVRYRTQVVFGYIFSLFVDVMGLYLSPLAGFLECSSATNSLNHLLIFKNSFIQANHSACTKLKFKTMIMAPYPEIIVKIFVGFTGLLGFTKAN